jgi:hypothetical protein
MFKRRKRRRNAVAFALYPRRKQLGPLGPIFLVGQMEKAIEKFNRTRKSRGKIPALLTFSKYGETHEPEKVAKDISKLLQQGST